MNDEIYYLSILFGFSHFIVLVFFCLLMMKAKRFHLLSPGAWVWFGFFLYFFLNPLSTFLSGENIEWYKRHLLLSGGSDRLIWINFVILIGEITFFLVYLHKRKTNRFKRMQNIRLPKIYINVILLLFLTLGLYSLIQYRLTSTNAVVENGRFAGQTIGWIFVAHSFMFVPIAYYSLSNFVYTRLFGGLLGVMYIVLSLPHDYSRFSILAVATILLLCFTKNISITVNKRSLLKKIKIFIPLFMVVIIAAILQSRGHVKWELDSALVETIIALISTIPSNLISIAAAQDTAMLGTLYLESYYIDSIQGYDYGIPIINYIFFGWIPSYYFPEKYFLIDWLNSFRASNIDIETSLIGGKSTIIGSLYSMGNIFAVIIGMTILAYLSKVLENLLTYSSHRLFHAAVISILSIVWIVVGSNITWALMNVMVITLPFLVIYTFSRFKIK